MTAIGATEAVRSKADGYTMFLAAGSTLVLNPLLYKSLAYDPARDFRVLDVARTDAENKTYVADENARWSRLIKAQNISLDNP